MIIVNTPEMQILKPRLQIKVIDTIFSQYYSLFENLFVDTEKSFKR